MNEITKIHLGRQPFVIAVDAHKALQEYLQEIRRQVDKNSDGVVEEVEMRMAELLAERGISGEKVVLAEDVAYLKEQLGSPRDFKDDDDTVSSKADNGEAEQAPIKRLFRDTEHGMVAGVSSGLANYFGIDAVIIRILFVIATVTGGWGIPLYVVMWLIMPEAKTASERLQMRGKAVTVDSLKEIVDRADVTGAAQRASRNVVTAFEVFAKIILAIVGVGVVLVGVALLAAIGMAGMYALLHDGRMLQGAIEFPLGTSETVAVVAGLGAAAVIVLFLLATGIAMIRRKWLVPGWGVAALCGLFLISIITAGATVPDTVQSVRDRYEANSHVEKRTLPAFEHVRIVRANVDVPVRYEDDADAIKPGTLVIPSKGYDMPSQKGGDAQGRTYYAELRYLGDVPASAIKTSVKDGTLTVDMTGFNPGSDWDCDVMCIGSKDFFTLVIHTPQPLRDAAQ